MITKTSRPKRDGRGIPAVPPYLTQMSPLRSDSAQLTIGFSMLTVRLRPELVAQSRAFPRAAREGTSPDFCRVRVSVFALTSLSTSDWLLSSVKALIADFPHYPQLGHYVNGEKSYYLKMQRMTKSFIKVMSFAHHPSAFSIQHQTLVTGGQIIV